MYCRSCGQMLEGTGRFCKYCGAAAAPPAVTAQVIYTDVPVQTPPAQVIYTDVPVQTPPAQTPSVQVPYPAAPVQTHPAHMPYPAADTPAPIHAKKSKTAGIIVAVCLIIAAAAAVYFIFDPFGWNHPKAAPGNTVGNLANFGLVAAYGERIYYANTNDNERMYSMNMDGSDNRRLSTVDYVQFINIQDGWIYFSTFWVMTDEIGIYKMRTDGSGIVKISNDSADCTTVAGNRIYYINNDNGRIYSIDFEGKDIKRLNSDKSEQMNVAGNLIYYSVNEEEIGSDNNTTIGVYVMETDGSNRRKIVDDNVYFLHVVGNTLYYVCVNDDRTIYSINADGSDRKQLNDSATGTMNVTNDRIYYSAGPIHSMRTDGSDNRLLNDVSADSISVVGDRIFYYRWDAVAGEYPFTMLTDGSGMMSIGEFTGEVTARPGDTSGSGLGEAAKDKFDRLLTDEERNFIRSSQYIPIAIAPDSYPLSYFDFISGYWEGVALDLLDEVELLSGLSFMLVNDQNAQVPELLQMLENGEAAMIVGIVQTEESLMQNIWAGKYFMFNNREEILAAIVQKAVNLIE